MILLYHKHGQSKAMQCKEAPKQFLLDETDKFGF